MLKKYTTPLHLVLYVLGIISLLVLSTPSFSRNLTQLFLAVGFSIFFEHILSHLFGRTASLVSSFISGLGIFFLFDSVYSSLYVLVAFLAIASKFFIRMNGKHILNPTNAALLLVGFSCADVATIGSFRWQAAGTLWSMFFIATGTYITRKVDRWVLVVTFYSAFSFFAAMKSIIFNLKFAPLLIELTGTPMHLFVFFMITDPKTSPSSRKAQVVAATSVAFIDTILRYYENRLGLLVSLVTVRILFSLYEKYSKPTMTPAIA